MFKVGMILMGSATIFMIGFFALTHYDITRLHPKSTTPEKLQGFASRVEYALRYQSLLVFWLVFNILATIFVRLSTLAINPLDETTEHRAQMMKFILTNSFESIVVSIFSQLIFVSYAEPVTVLKYIPLINIIQFVGRVAFLAGYPLRRAFGYHCTSLPTLVLTVYNLYKLGSFLEVY